MIPAHDFHALRRANRLPPQAESLAKARDKTPHCKAQDAVVGVKTWEDVRPESTRCLHDVYRRVFHGIAERPICASCPQESEFRKTNIPN